MFVVKSEHSSAPVSSVANQMKGSHWVIFACWLGCVFSTFTVTMGSLKLQQQLETVLHNCLCNHVFAVCFVPRWKVHGCDTLRFLFEES